MSAKSQLETVLRVLNEAFAADPAAIYALCMNRVPCNQTLADHPTIQVGGVPVENSNLFEVGGLGLVNGIVEAITGGRVAASWSDGETPRLLGFVEYKSTPAAIPVSSFG